MNQSSQQTVACEARLGDEKRHGRWHRMGSSQSASNEGECHVHDVIAFLLPFMGICFKPSSSILLIPEPVRISVESIESLKAEIESVVDEAVAVQLNLNRVKDQRLAQPTGPQADKLFWTGCSLHLKKLRLQWRLDRLQRRLFEEETRRGLPVTPPGTSCLAPTFSRVLWSHCVSGRVLQSSKPQGGPHIHCCRSLPISFDP